MVSSTGRHSAYLADSVLPSSPACFRACALVGCYMYIYGTLHSLTIVFRFHETCVEGLLVSHLLSVKEFTGIAVLSPRGDFMTPKWDSEYFVPPFWASFHKNIPVSLLNNKSASCQP